MSLNIAIQMDPPESLNIEKDSTFVLALEAQKRGYNLFYYNPASLSLRDGDVTAEVAPVTFYRKKERYFHLEKPLRRNLETFDIILMRQDFNHPMVYNATTHILDHLKGKTLVLNDPTGVRESPEKILITHYPHLAPDTLITRDLEQIRQFYKEHGDIIIKPLNGFGGLDVFHIRKDEDTLDSVYKELTGLHTEPLVVQRYIPEIRIGDKRIIVVEGEPIAAVLRVPQEGSARANLNAGGTAAKAEVTNHERDICKTLKPELVKRGLVFVGLDVIGPYVTEINPKSPTGLQHIYRLQGIKCEEAIWDAYERRFKQHMSS